MAELRKALVAVSPDHKTLPAYFQALLTTTVENAVPGMHRWSQCGRSPTDRLSENVPQDLSDHFDAFGFFEESIHLGGGRHRRLSAGASHGDRRNR